METATVEGGRDGVFSLGQIVEMVLGEICGRQFLSACNVFLQNKETKHNVVASTLCALLVIARSALGVVLCGVSGWG